MNTATHEAPSEYRYPNRTDKVQAVRRIRDGAPIFDIANQFRVSDIVVRGWLKEYDHAANQPDPIETPEDTLVLEAETPIIEEPQDMAKTTVQTRKTFTDAQKIDAVRNLLAGAKTVEVAEKLGTTTNTLYAWKEKFGSKLKRTATSEADRPLAAKPVSGVNLSDRNRQLETIVVDQMLEIQRLKGKMH